MASIDWRDIPVFRGVDLEDSFVLSWECSDEELAFELEVSLWPPHQDYEAPRPDEYTCYKRGRLILRRSGRVDGLIPMADAQKSVDADGAVDFGNIDSLQLHADGYIEICGSFGVVRLEGEGIDLEIVR